MNVVFLLYWDREYNTPNILLFSTNQIADIPQVSNNSKSLGKKDNFYGGHTKNQWRYEKLVFKNFCPSDRFIFLWKVCIQNAFFTSARKTFPQSCSYWFPLFRLPLCKYKLFRGCFKISKIISIKMCLKTIEASMTNPSVRLAWAKHCIKNVHIRNYSGPYFPAFRLNTALRSISSISLAYFSIFSPNAGKYGPE